MSTNQEEKFRIYRGSTEIEVTKVMIEEDGWNATELLYEDLKNFRRVGISNNLPRN